MLCFCLFCISLVCVCKTDIRNPLSLLAHERSCFATCQRKLLIPTDICIPPCPRLVPRALEAGECLFRVQSNNTLQTTHTAFFLYTVGIYLALIRKKGYNEKIICTDNTQRKERNFHYGTESCCNDYHGKRRCNES